MGALILIARLADALSDPLVGVISDRTRTRFGRRRPYIALGSIALAVLLATLYTPPHGSQALVTAWFGASIILLSLAWTVVDVPWESLGPEITHGYDERTALFSLREGMTIAGTVLAAASPLIIEQAFSLTDSPADQRAKFMIFGIVFVPLTILFCWLCAAYIKEPASSPAPEAIERRQFWKNWCETFSNRPFKVLLLAYAVAAIGANLPATLILYYVQYVLGGTNTEVFLLLYVVSGILFLPFWLWVSRRFDKKRAWIAAMLVNVGAFVGVFFLGRGDLAAYGALTVVSGTGFGAALALPVAMQADVIDYDELLYGSRREGRFIGVWSIVRKGASALGMGLALPILDFLGYSPGQEQNEDVILALRVLYCLVPTICSFGAILIALAYPLSRERHLQVLDSIKLRRQGKPAPDPLQQGQTLQPIKEGAL
jgi:GPH family glycoside/pentoside/hexuronide:cation symporter